PWLAGLLPMRAPMALATTSFFCLAGVLAGLVVIGRRLGFTPLDTIVGILGVSLSASMLYTFHNPYLTDMFGLAAVVAALVALLARKPLVFAAIVTLGSAGR